MQLSDLMQLTEKSREALIAAQAPMAEAYTIATAAVVSGIGRTKLYEEINEGRLKSFVQCGRRLILRDDLRDWLLAAARPGKVRTARRTPHLILTHSESPTCLLQAF